MGEAFGNDLALRLALQRVVADRRGCFQPLFHVARLQQILVVRRPDAGVAIGLQLDPDLDGIAFFRREPRLLSDQIFTPGRTDWSSQGLIAYFIGETWNREVWTIYADGTGMAQVTQGGDAQSPSFSPGGRYIAYTGYTDVAGHDEFSCEIFIMDLYSREQWQLTDNEYCDYQPRWGK